MRLNLCLVMSFCLFNLPSTPVFADDDEECGVVVLNHVEADDTLTAQIEWQGDVSEAIFEQASTEEVSGFENFAADEYWYIFINAADHYMAQLNRNQGGVHETMVRVTLYKPNHAFFPGRLSVVNKFTGKRTNLTPAQWQNALLNVILFCN